MFLLDEELSNVCLCALHSEMRNTEQLLGSLGLFAYRCNSLPECNEAIGQYMVLKCLGGKKGLQ